MIEHHIQREIVNRLSQAKSLRFSELKPKELEANLFMYHLKRLIKDGYVTKTSNGYELATQGLTYVDGLTLSDGKPRKQAKILCILALQRPDGSWLLGRRKYQPYIGQLMFLSGKQHFGESPEAHAKREVYEKVGSELELTRRGMVDIRITRGGEPLTHIIGHIYHAIISEDLIVPVETDQHTYSWYGSLSDDDELLPGTKEIYNVLHSSDDSFFVSLDLESM
ncbi:MAG TPA: NUDIX hydrolase [Verrucomicrobiae bacterium]|nr:NUDIX hydrolase [Verrucomicrobiae bacterium]